MFHLTKKHKYIPHKNQYIEELRIYNSTEVADALKISRAYWSSIVISYSKPSAAILDRIEKLCIQARKVREARVAGKTK